MSNEIIRRVLRSEIKSINEKEFSVDVTMSDETVDRYKEVIKATAWKKGLGNYKEHPILLSSHNYHGLMNQIGEASKIGIKDNALKATFTYLAGKGNPEADWAWVLASKGVAAYSVGFIKKAGRYVESDEDYKDDDEMKEFQKQGVRYVYDEVELLECSHVTVPANPSCLQNSFDQGIVMRSLEEQAYPMLGELEVELKKLSQNVSKPIDEEDFGMKLADFEEMVESLKAKIAADFAEQMKVCLETMTTTLQLMSDQLVEKTMTTLDSELEKRKANEVDAVIGEDKKDEIIPKDTDGVVDVFKAITLEFEKTFGVQS